MKCLNCGNEIVSEESKYCNMCGAKLPNKKVQCKSCGKLLESSAKFCKYCGASLENAEAIYFNEPAEMVNESKKDDENKLPNKLKILSVLSLGLIFCPVMSFFARIAAIVISIIALAKLKKVKKQNPDIKIKPFRLFPILGIILGVVLTFAVVGIYLFMFFGGSTLEQIFSTLPEYFL